MGESPPDPHLVFTRLFVAAQPGLHGFLMALVHDAHAADDLLQDLAERLWRKFDQYDPARPFIAWAIGFARRLVRTIRGNLWWAFGYNVVGVALACSGRLNPALAALLMVISSVLVIMAALRAGRLDQWGPAPLEATIGTESARLPTADVSSSPTP